MYNGNPFFIQGVCYYPIPVGFEPSVKYEQYRDNPQDRQVWERDLNLISSMGGNAIRMYGFENDANHTAFFDAALSKGIQVLVQYWWDTAIPLTDPSIKAGFINLITKQQHPAVAMWIINNELNFKYTGQDLINLFNLFNELVDEVVKIEGTNHRPVTTTLANLNDMIGTIKQFDSMTKLDAWSVQLYSGYTFDDVFRRYETVSSKPLIVTEFGVDAFDEKTQSINEDNQRTAATSLFQILYDNENVTSGGTIYSFVDEWWKCGNNDQHDNCGYQNNGFYDGKMNEEYFGLYSTKKNPTGPDTLTPRSAVSALTSMWKQHSLKSTVSSTSRATTSTRSATGTSVSSTSRATTSTRSATGTSKVTVPSTGGMSAGSSETIPSSDLSAGSSLVVYLSICIFILL
jgi:hypothetical protein